MTLGAVSAAKKHKVVDLAMQLKLVWEQNCWCTLVPELYCYCIALPVSGSVLNMLFLVSAIAKHLVIAKHVIVENAVIRAKTGS